MASPLPLLFFHNSPKLFRWKGGRVAVRERLPRTCLLPPKNVVSLSSSAPEREGSSTPALGQEMCALTLTAPHSVVAAVSHVSLTSHPACSPASADALGQAKGRPPLHR